MSVIVARRFEGTFPNPTRRAVLKSLAAWPLAASSARSAPASAAADIGTQPATPGTVDDERIQAAFAELERSGISAVVAISRMSGPIIVREFGILRNDGVPAEETQVDLNSITKTVTGVMVLKLVEQGNVRLDETLAEIFPDVPADKASITVHQLLTHSAGLVPSVGPDEERLTRDAFLERALSTTLASAPGERYGYSNVGYSLLAAIVEERSGKTYDAYLREDMLVGSGVEETGYASVYDERRSMRSGDGRAIREASWGGHDPYWNLIGNGGLISTAVDFVRLRQAVTSGRIISPDLVARSQVAHVPEDSAGTSYYGYGLVVQDLPGIGRIYWHDGGNGVFSTRWTDAVEQGDVVFTAAVDTPEGDANSAMTVMAKHLYGVADE